MLAICKLPEKTKDRAYALNFMLGDNKRIVDVEANPLKVTATRSNVFLHHANHYVYGTEGFTDPKSGDSRGEQRSKMR